MSSKEHSNQISQDGSHLIKAGAFLLFMGVLIALQALTSAVLDPSIDIVSPSENQYVNTPNVVFDFYVNFNSTECRLLLEGTAIQNITNLTSGFSSFSQNITSKHTWNIECDLDNSTISTPSRNITLDQSEPTIVLFNPQNGQQQNTADVNVSFVALDNYDPEINCTLELGNYTANTLATNSLPTSININNVSNGQYSWQLTCLDGAENTKITDERILIVNATQNQVSPVYILTLNRRSFATGENAYANVMAPQNTSIRIEVCPNKTGFVECSTTINYPNYTAFPLEAQLPFTNKEGSYIVEAYFTGAQGMQSKTENYIVNSTITINTDVSARPRINTPVLLEASSSGGIGKINFTWHLSDGTKIYRNKANITYTSAGNYTNTINVTDEQGNSRIKQISFEVSAAYNTKIIVKDSITGAALKDASVDIDNQDKDTDINGEANIYVRSGDRKLIISKQNYTVFNQEILVSSDNTITVQLVPNQIVKPKPTITLTYPPNGQQLISSSTEVGFTISHSIDSNCSVYISEQPTGFFTYLGSTPVPANDKDERRFQVIDLESKTYYWNVECIDKSASSGTSETRNFVVSLNPQQATQKIESDSRESQITAVLNEIDAMSPELKETIEALGLKNQIEDAGKALKNKIRDLESLNYRDLDAASLEAEKQKIETRTDEAFEKAPISFEILKSDNFVDYIDESELEPLAEEILKIKLGEDVKLDMKNIMKNLVKMQQEAVTSTKVRTIQMSYASGDKRTITAVIREVKTFNLSEDTYFIESIPKEIASSATEIISPLDFETIKEDPIIGFKLTKDTKIAYYFDQEISTEQIRNIKSAIISQHVADEPAKITGFSISSITSGFKTNPLVISLIVALLAVTVFGTVKYEGHRAAQYALYLAQKKEKTHYVNVIVSDINNNLEAGNLSKAVELYSEAKKAYADLPTVAKNDVYEQIISAARKIEEYQHSITSGGVSNMLSMIAQAENHIATGQMTEAIHQYKMIEEAFHEMDDTSKEAVHAQISGLGNKLQILIASNT